jgi:hypothetical protein
MLGALGTRDTPTDSPKRVVRHRHCWGELNACSKKQGKIHEVGRNAVRQSVKRMVDEAHQIGRPRERRTDAASEQVCVGARVEEPRPLQTLGVRAGQG